MDLVVEKVGLILEHLEQRDFNIQHLSVDDLNYIPVYVFKTKIHPTSLQRLFPYLPIHKKFLLKLHLPCHKHINKSKDDSQPPPIRKQCVYCIEENA